MSTQAVVPAAQPAVEGKEQERIPEPCVVVIFGASGDLTKRKLLPALFHLEQQGLLPKDFAVVGVARRDISATFAPDMQDGIVKGGGVDAGDSKLKPFIDRVKYFATEFDSDEGFEGLKTFLEGIDKQFGTKGNRLFYLAVAPEFFADITERLGKHGMTKAEGSWIHVIIEKPFGTDLASARKLNDEINAVLSEDQIFRIDHYLGKETVQNILVFRFGNGIFEPIWNRNYIDRVEITAAESIGIEGRGPFYESAGALRDVLQNHVMEVLSFVAMEPPDSFESEAVRTEKLKVWRAIQPIPVEDTVRGQYGPGTVDGDKVIGYRQEDRVNPESSTETYAAMKLQIENWRWAGVPIYIRAGKRLAKRVTEVTVTFKQPPLHLFKSNDPTGQVKANTLKMRIQPDEGITLTFGAKIPGPTTNVKRVEMHFSYAEAFGKSSANGYERLLLDAMLGDGTLFAHRDGVEATWALMTPILEAWAKTKPTDFPNYEAGSWGPEASDALLKGRAKVAQVVRPDEEGPDGRPRESLGHSFRAHTGDTGAAFEEHNASVVVVKKSHTVLWGVLILVVLLLAALVYYFTRPKTAAGGGTAAAGRGQNGPAAITVGQSKTGNINIYVDALGTVTPIATVTLYSQITGRVMAVYYHEGQFVKKGQPLVDIDPRPAQATLTQAEGSLQHDEGVLAQAKIDFGRYQAAYAKNAIAKQQLDDQEQAVVQNEGTVKADQGTVEYDKVQLSYCHIVSPINGRVGLRLVDPGNTVFSGSSSTLAVITQLQPMTVVFSPSEDSIPQIQTALKGNKALEVDAYDRADEKMLEAGKLTAYDNQIDTTTGTVKFRAQFPNKDLSLFPNQFVNAQLLVKTLTNATLIPTGAVQHNGTAAFVYLVKPNNTVAVQPIDVVTNNDTDTAVTGIDPGASIATSGFDRLEGGAKVQVKQPGKKGAKGASGSTGSSGSAGASGATGGKGGSPSGSPATGGSTAP